MGNRHANAPTDISADLAILCDSSTTQEQRRPVFQRLNQHFAPVISHQPCFAEELRRTFALRFQQWEGPPTPWSADAGERLADRIRGLIFGAALGDAVGLATEFLSRDVVEAHYGDAFDFRPGCEVYADSHRLSFPLGDWTDDTDQLLLILWSLLETGGRADMIDFGRKLTQWRDHGFEGLGDQSGCGLGQHTKSVISHPSFAEDPAKAAHAVWEKRSRQVASNGAVMRTAVTGIPFFWDLAVVHDNTKKMCEATHADPRCVASCVAVATAAALLLQASKVGEEHANVAMILEEALGCALPLLNEEQQEELKRHAQVSSLEELELDEPRAIGYTMKCLGAGLWALRQCDSADFETTIRAVVMQGGDADTNAAVAGALLGCYWGHSQLPEHWMSAMPYTPWLEAWVQKLLHMLQLPVTNGRRAKNECPNHQPSTSTDVETTSPQPDEAES